MPRRNRNAKRTYRPATPTPAPEPRGGLYTRDPRLLDQLARELVDRGLCSPAVLNQANR